MENTQESTSQKIKCDEAMTAYVKHGKHGKQKLSVLWYYCCYISN